MPTLEHETTAQLFHDNHELAPFLLASLGLPVPAGEVTIGDSNLSVPDPGLALPRKEQSPLARRADVVTIIGETAAPELVVVDEIQLDPPDLRKWWSWLVYIAVAGSRYLCPVTLLVLALKDETARKCAAIFETGHPRLRLELQLITRHNTPDPGIPRAAPFASQLTVLGVMNGKYRLDDPQTQAYVLDQLARTDPKLQASYTDSVLQVASEAARQAMEESMRTKYRTTLVDTLLAEGRAEGQAEAAHKLLLGILATRGIAVPEAVSARIMACTDTDLLESWALRAVTAAGLDEVFAE